jgi:hypothetical protein
MRKLTLGFLLLSACTGDSVHSAGQPSVTSVDTAATGERVIGFEQPITVRSIDGVETTSAFGWLVVSADGTSQKMEQHPPAGLAADCSDQPARLGDCVPAQVSQFDGTTTYSFPDGGDLLLFQGKAERYGSDGGLRWQLDDVSSAERAVRGGLVILVRGGYAVETEVDTGGEKWRIAPPASL